MSLDPVPLHLVRVGQFGQPLPKGLVLDCLSVLCLPTAGKPTVDPLRDPLAEIARVGVQLNAAAPIPPIHVRQRGNGSLYLHLVVGGVRRVPTEHDLTVLAVHDRRPSARSRVRVAATIGVDGYCVGACMIKEGWLHVRMPSKQMRALYHHRSCLPKARSYPPPPRGSYRGCDPVAGPSVYMVIVVLYMCPIDALART